ncbi:MAG: hypothetical protein A2W17_00330 [Planctomycetes bacterium RBG_16_41_13]|nr:MAG: hypothetical protein A2W17_00330 [Planctomycetes bacterium RBG_16_41_13]
MNAYMPVIANASPLHRAANIVIVGNFQKTKVLLKFSYPSIFDIRYTVKLIRNFNLVFMGGGRGQVERRTSVRLYINSAL